MTASGQQLLLSPQSAKKRLFMEQSSSSSGIAAKAGQSLLQSSGTGRVAINIQSTLILVPAIKTKYLLSHKQITQLILFVIQKCLLHIIMVASNFEY